MVTDELIDRRPAGRAGLAKWYYEVFEAQRAEGMKVADLADLLEVTPTNIYYWHRRLRELATKGRKCGGVRAKPGLVRVKVRENASGDPVGAVCSGLEVRLSHSRSIFVAPGFDAATLRELVTALEAC